MLPMDKYDDRFDFRVKHRYSEAPRYTWEIHNIEKVLPVKESMGRFDSWEKASQAGKDALKHFLNR